MTREEKTDMKMFIVAMALFLLVLLFLAGCKAKDANAEWRPPVLEGKCVVDRYFEGKAYDQWCNFKGYAWKCGPIDCVRVGEAKGEQTAVPAPPPAAPTPASAVGSGT